MTIQKNADSKPIIEKSPHRYWIIWDVFLVIGPVLCIVLIPLMFYLIGRFSPYILSFCIILLLSWLIFAFILYCFVYGVVEKLNANPAFEVRKKPILLPIIGVTDTWLVH